MKTFVKKITDAAETSGERIWQLPLTDDYVDDMKGTYADLSNVANAKGGGSSQGAAFLSQFVEDGIKWAHLILQAPLGTRAIVIPTILIARFWFGCAVVHAIGYGLVMGICNGNL